MAARSLQERVQRWLTEGAWVWRLQWTLHRLTRCHYIAGSPAIHLPSTSPAQPATGKASFASFIAPQGPHTDLCIL